MQRKNTKKALARASVPLPEGAQAIVDQLVQGPDDGRSDRDAVGSAEEGAD